MGRGNYTNLTKNFDPVVDIAWDGAYTRKTLKSFEPSSTWTNSKGVYSSMSKDGTRPVPIYNSFYDALEFIRSNSPILVYNKSFAMSLPYEWYIRFQLKSLGALQYLISSTDNIYLAITANGAVNVSSGVGADGVIGIGQWYVLRILHVSGTSSKYELNLNGVEVTVNGGNSSTGQGTSRLGASWRNANFADALISEVFYKDTPLTPDEKDKMKKWWRL